MLAQARAKVDADLLLVDIRSVDERQREGVIPGARHIPLSVLPWRSDDLSEAW